MNILITDDNKKLRLLLKKTLESAGYTIEVAANGKKALEIAEKNPPDLIISDILMPVMDGFTLCRNWKKNDFLKDIPFIFYTATYIDYDDKKLAMSLGADRFVLKSTKLNKLIKIIEGVIEDVKKGKTKSKKPVLQDNEIFKVYNERLIKKLENKILSFEKEIKKRKQVEEALRQSEEKYRVHFENISDVIFSINLDLKIINISPSIERILGYKSEELIGKSFQDINLLAPEYLDKALSDAIRVLSGERIASMEYEFIAKDGTRKFGEVSGAPINYNGKVVAMVSVARDITERKQAEKALKKKEKQLSSKTNELQEVNAALKVLLNRIEKDKEELEEKVLSNVKELVLPYIGKLEKSQLKSTQETYLKIIKSNLDNIVAPFLRQLSSKYSNLTPREIQVAELVKEGKTTKDIAELLISSTRAIEFHRNNLRKKLGLTNKKTNLRSYLLTLT